MAGRWEFPGGIVEPGESAADGIIREVKEETGLTIHHPQLVGMKHWYTKEDVRAVLASKSAAGYKKEVKELLEKYGAQQLKQVNPDDYAAILKEAEVIGNA